jgi:hypothetical protein
MPSIVEANPFGGAAIVIGPIALWRILYHRQFDPLFLAILEESDISNVPRYAEPTLLSLLLVIAETC